jgi:transcriptional regulator with XRE-family HTH domain
VKDRVEGHSQDVLAGPVKVTSTKAARALGWSQEDLALNSGVSYPTGARLESFDGEIGGRPETVEKLVSALEAAGVEFTNGDQPREIEEGRGRMKRYG